MLYLNLLIITATMRRTKIVMMEMVITRFVAILKDSVSHPRIGKPSFTMGFALPARHSPQSLDAPVDIALTV